MTTAADFFIAKEPAVRDALTIAFCALLISACAGQPDSRASGTASVPVASAAPPAATSAAPGAIPGAPPAPTAAPRVAGYVRVVKGGVARYCRDDLQTGSHIMTQTTCLTEQEFSALEDQTRRDVNRIRNTMSGSNTM